LVRGCLLRAGQPVHLRPQAYEVLKYLAENRGRLIGKDRLIETVWHGRAVTDDALVQCLMEVRHALGAKGKLYVRNVRGRGYIFDPEASEPQKLKGNSIWSEQVDLLRVVVEDEEEIVNARETDQTASQPAGLTAPRAVAADAARGSAAAGVERVFKRAERHKRVALLVLAALILAAIVAAFAYFKYSASRSQAITSIAILPFANESVDPNMEYLSDGISESLINTLSQLPGLKVIARSSTFKYKGQAADTQEVARALGVQAVLTGLVAQHGDDLVVSAELVDARDRTQLWGERYSRKASDIQAVQEEMARTISEKLRLRLTGAQEQQLTKHATENSQAYQFYLNGLFFRRKGGVEDLRRALDYFNQAVALDPNFALAWAGAAHTHLHFAGNSLLDPKEANAKAKAAAQKALELDETLPEAHVALAIVKQHEWDWAGAEREYTRAIELNPNLVEAHTSYSSYLSLMGRHTEALAEIKRAQELDPLRVSLRGFEAFRLFLARRYDEAIELRRSVEVETGMGYTGLGFMYEAKGMYAEAVNEFQKAISIYGETTGILCYLGSALALSGRREEAQAILDKLKRTKEYVSPTELATVYISLGDKERGLAMLEKAYAAHDLQLQTLKVDWHFDSLRSDPRFQDLMRRVGLPQ
ncbi:MAG TPA: winged helix-turn-helix domain-containing protein, partial [Pyrinomonadaceae bacterium]|nr:winged helix-turn-helix domain-containing protein [Pyrinomonadaceae bacterium]